MRTSFSEAGGKAASNGVMRFNCVVVMVSTDYMKCKPRVRLAKNAEVVTSPYPNSMPTFRRTEDVQHAGKKTVSSLRRSHLSC